MSVVTAALELFPLKEYNLLIACSGGVDSMVLLHALLESGIRGKVLHVNYGLRGKESDADEQLVRKVCTQAQLEVEVIHCDEDQLRSPGVNLQAEARDIRRKAFTDWINLSGKHKVIVAHHADDQVETFFLQLFRGSGTFGLGGMHPERDGIIRPFLTLSKSELRTYALVNGISWREDSSNASSYYLRNLFRNELLPVLKQADPRLEEQVLLLMELFRSRQLELYQKVDPALQLWRENQTLSCATWLSWEDDTRLAFVKRMDWPLWSAARLTELANNRSGTVLPLEDLRLTKTKEGFIRNEKNRGGNHWDFKIETIEFLPDEFDKWNIYLDEDALHGALSFKTPQTGDRIRSLGLKGSQLVSDVLKDADVTPSERKNYALLTDGQRILWIPGIKVSRDAIAGKNTRKILKVSLVNNSF